jgi:hypothetical protein
LCEFYGNRETTLELKYHKQLIFSQREQYSKEKLAITSEKTPTTVLVTQNFTQIVFEKFCAEFNYLYLHTIKRKKMD